jgi:transposase InsO family protein
MILHANAALSRRQRERLVARSCSPAPRSRLPPWWSGAHARRRRNGSAARVAARGCWTAPRGRTANRAGLLPRSSRRPAHPRRPSTSPCPGKPILPPGPDALSSRDNGSCFRRQWQEGCKRRGIAARRTRPFRPQTNGKVERFIRTLLELWAYAYPYNDESERAAALAPALDSYNRFRRHRALGGQTPLQRVNNLSGTNT